jgi:hypothetical protein
MLKDHSDICWRSWELKKNLITNISQVEQRYLLYKSYIFVCLTIGIIKPGQKFPTYYSTVNRYEPQHLSVPTILMKHIAASGMS